MKTNFFEKYQVLTDTGFQDFDGIVQHEPKSVYRVFFDNGKFLDCTKDQKLFVKNNDWLEVKDLTKGSKVRYEKTYTKVKEIHFLKKQIVYDLINVSNGLKYYVNGFLVHNCLYCDEFAFIENDVEFYTSTYPVVTSGDSTKMIITSTPNGMNYFYKLWTEAEQGDNEFRQYHVHWSEHPKRDEKWKHEQLVNMSEKQFSQEFECEFLGSSGTLISGHKLKQLAKKTPIKETYDLKVYENPDPERKYVCINDVAEGVGQDYSVCSIIDTTEMPYRQVAVYKNNEISPTLFAEVIERMAKLYNDALVIVETNNHGVLTLDTLWNDLEYENILKTKVEDAENVAGGKKSYLGLKTTKKSKPMGCSYLKDLIEQDQLLINDFDTINELSTFIKSKNSWQAERGKHDDIVMTLVIFAWFANQPYFEDEVGINTGNVLRGKLKEDDNYQTNFLGFFDDGIHDDSGFDYSLVM